MEGHVDLRSQVVPFKIHNPKRMKVCKTNGNEITNLAYSGGATTANNYNFIQRLIGIATNSCPAL